MEVRLALYSSPLFSAASSPHSAGDLSQGRLLRGGLSASSYSHFVMLM